MQPEKLVAWFDAFFEATPSIEASNLTGPSVSLLNARYELRADSKLGSNIFLHRTRSDTRENRSVPIVKGAHPVSLALNERHGGIGFGGLDKDERTHAPEESLNVRCIRDGIAEQTAVAALLSPFVFLDATISGSAMDGIERCSHSVGKPDANTALRFVNLDASLAVEEASDVAPEGVFGPVFHALHIAQAPDSNNVVAVPVLRWIGERIALVDHLSSSRKEAA